MLDRLEAALRGAFEGVGRLLPGKLEPLELASQLREAMRSSQTLSAYGTYAANRYEVRINLDDLQRFVGVKDEIEQELARNLRMFAQEEQLLCGPNISVAVVGDEHIKAGHSRVSAEFNDEPMVAHLAVTGGTDSPATFEVHGDALIGRDHNCDVVVDTYGVSRRHAQLKWSYIGYVIKDLNSTNGTFVSGLQVTEQLLSDGDMIQLGSAQLRFTSHSE